MYFIHKKHGKSNRKLFGQGQGYGEKNHPHPHPTKKPHNPHNTQKPHHPHPTQDSNPCDAVNSLSCGNPPSEDNFADYYKNNKTMDERAVHDCYFNSAQSENYKDVSDCIQYCSEGSMGSAPSCLGSQICQMACSDAYAHN